MSTQAEQIIEMFGGVCACARAVNLRASTIQGWKERGVIPQKRWPEVIAAGQSEGLSLTFDDFTRHMAQASKPTAQRAGAQV